MKKMTVSLALAALLFGLLGAGALAEVPDCDFPPTGNEDDVRIWVEGATSWDLTDDARAFLTGGFDGACNAEVWEVGFSSTVEMAQWIDISVGDTEWLWYVRKPGDYFTDCISATIRSNGNVLITFTGFTDLEYDDDNELDGVNQTIETWYGHSGTSTLGPQSDQWSGWYSPDELNQESAILYDSAALHEDGLLFKLWNRINVVDCNSAGIYSGGGTVVVTLQNAPCWLDENGDWIDEG